jgi:hypothetical protein
MGFQIRADRGRNRGRVGLPGERAEYLRLMDLGTAVRRRAGRSG